MTAQLRLVPPSPSLDEQPKFIGPDYAAIRARNWARVHILADKREPVEITPHSSAALRKAVSHE